MERKKFQQDLGFGQERRESHNGHVHSVTFIYQFYSVIKSLSLFLALMKESVMGKVRGAIHFWSISIVSDSPGESLGNELTTASILQLNC